MKGDYIFCKQSRADVFVERFNTYQLGTIDGVHTARGLDNNGFIVDLYVVSYTCDENMLDAVANVCSIALNVD